MIHYVSKFVEYKWGKEGGGFRVVISGYRWGLSGDYLQRIEMGRGPEGSGSLKKGVNIIFSW